MELCGEKDERVLRNVLAALSEQALLRDKMARDAKWPERVAVGSLPFVEERYEANFIPENFEISPENTYFGRENFLKTNNYLGPTPIQAIQIHNSNSMAKLLPLDERLNVAAQLVKRARIFYDIWWFYEGADTRPKILDTMNVYSEFFRFDTHAHFVSMVIYLAGLFETRSDTINFYALINEAKAAGVPKAAVDMALEMMTVIKCIQSKVPILRNNLFGHRSASLSYTEAFRKAGIKPDQLRDLTVVGLKIANTLLQARGLDEQFFHELSLSDVERLINDLAETNPS